MNIYKVQLAGPTKVGKNIPDVFATIHREKNNEYINVTISRASGDEKVHKVQADCIDDAWSMAECLQEVLDGHKGTNSMIHQYFQLLQNFMG